MNFEKEYKEVLLRLEKEESEKSKLQKEYENLRIQTSELEVTNNYLVAATWRERDLKKKLSDTLEELSKTKEIVESQNKRISESINYARKIQLAINPTETDLINQFSDSFILYIPKDVISGDFPWLFKIKEYLYLAAVDCTGHGVPGAMMSMIGNLLLNDIVNDGNVLLPSVILKRLHFAVVQTLKQDLSDSNSNDGMDIGLCRINLTTREIVFSGAHRPLFLLRNNQVEILSGDKFPIGGMHYKGLNSFTDQILEFRENDTLFLFTDGFPDQIGGSERKKLMVKNLKTFIEANSECKMQDLKIRLSEYYNNWKGSNKQIDDILVLGIRFK